MKKEWQKKPKKTGREGKQQDLSKDKSPPPRSLSLSLSLSLSIYIYMQKLLSYLRI